MYLLFGSHTDRRLGDLTDQVCLRVKSDTQERVLDDDAIGRLGSNGYVAAGYGASDFHEVRAVTEGRQVHLHKQRVLAVGSVG